MSRIVGTGQWRRANARYGLRQAVDSLANLLRLKRVQPRQARVSLRCDGSIEREARGALNLKSGIHFLELCRRSGQGWRDLGMAAF